ncbi:MAG: glycosyltransferase family 2 protein [Coxiellaceae bacterium]|nr:MAG: glycosyltransferase family 2 protein [Coxiellaceae bacterium]
MKLAATVLIPTHDHCQLLNYSIPSVLSQTVRDIEIFIIGDGVPEGTRKIVADFMKQDERIKFFDFPKGARLGEAYRHEIILQHAQGEIICYHSDDDLMMPHHVAILQHALKNADFAHTLPVLVLADNSLEILPVDLGIADFHNMVLTEINRIPLSNAAHTLQFYRSLPYGWRTTPVGAATDHYMWQQILSQPTCRAVTIPQPSVIGFPSSHRRDWTIADRLKELNNWQKAWQIIL